MESLNSGSLLLNDSMFKSFLSLHFISSREKPGHSQHPTQQRLQLNMWCHCPQVLSSTTTRMVFTAHIPTRGSAPSCSAFPQEVGTSPAAPLWALTTATPSPVSLVCTSKPLQSHLPPHSKPLPHLQVFITAAPHSLGPCLGPGLLGLFSTT